MLISTSFFMLAYSAMLNMESSSHFRALNTTEAQRRLRSQFEAQSYAVAFSSKSRRLAFRSGIHEYVRAENSSLSSPLARSSSRASRKKNTRKKLMIWALGFFLGAIAAIITATVLSILYKIIAVVRRRKNSAGPTIFSPLIKKPEYLSFLENEDEVEALEVIGEGACGKVYKAPLQSGDGRLLAIKRIKIPETEPGGSPDKNIVQMRSEIDTVGRVRHKNIVPLLAHVVGNGCHYLVYEFVKNGSLQDAMRDAASGTRELEWAARKSIAMGIALGLEYLHSQQRPRIFHRDLKPANILLDEDMEARIADFGLAKIIADGASHMETSHVAGTFGYMDPQYARTLKYTEKCDVYSFGMILGVLVTGKQPGDLFFRDNDVTMVQWIRQRVNSAEAIDPNLSGQGFKEEILRLLNVAYVCTLEDAAERPNAIQAREMLSQI